MGKITKTSEKINIGDVFGSLVVVSKDGTDITCQCECGNEVIIKSYKLLRGSHTHCSNDCPYSHTIIKLKGKKFGKLLVLDDYNVYRNRKSKSRNVHYVHCVCDCGREYDCEASALVSKGKTMCPICTEEVRISKMGTHRMSDTRFYNIWDHMNNRCYNPNNPEYYNYGGRGIRVLWNSFEEFRDDMYEDYLIHCEKEGEDRTSIDRFPDMNGNYCKDNCRWATPEEQNWNRRITRIYTYKGNSYNLKELAELLNIDNIRLFRGRLKQYNYDVEKTYDHFYRKEE